MTNKEKRDFENIETALRLCKVENCSSCPLFGIDGSVECFNIVGYINRLESEKQLAETQLKELLSALYQKTGRVLPFILEQKDVLELAKDYGIKEEELK